MKIRYGFVSNSSSSSFLVVASLQKYEEVYQSCSDYQKKLMDEFFENNELEGKPVKIMCEVIGSEVAETLTCFPIIPEYELAVADARWQLFDLRHNTLLSAIGKFDNNPGVIFKELCM